MTVEWDLQRTQRAWAALPLRRRLKVLERTRSLLSQKSETLAAAMNPELTRTQAETRVLEILPLLAACRFLEQNAHAILRVRRLGRRGLPFWLSGLDSEVRRVPFGVVLVIGPSNYPLFLPGAQALQALAAGNAVVWKPGRGGRAVAKLVAEIMYASGLQRELLHVTEDSVEAGEEALHSGPDKLIFTGSVESAHRVLQVAAKKLIPCVIEASGCDAVIVLPSADMDRLIKALVFGMRLNGSATCMAPRRLLILKERTGSHRLEDILERLTSAFKKMPAVLVPFAVLERLRELLSDAVKSGATVHGEVGARKMQPILITGGIPSMKIAQANIFAPILTVIEVDTIAQMLKAQDCCPFGLTAAVFGGEREARSVAEMCQVRTVLINDVIVSTADPRVPFGGRGLSGFGVTRGTEGLLEMTAAKVVTVRRNKGTRQYEAAKAAHEPLFDGMIQAGYSGTLWKRLKGLKLMVQGAKDLWQSEGE